MKQELGNEVTFPKFPPLSPGPFLCVLPPFLCVLCVNALLCFAFAFAFAYFYDHSSALLCS